MKAIERTTLSSMKEILLRSWQMFDPSRDWTIPELMEHSGLNEREVRRGLTILIGRHEIVPGKRPDSYRSVDRWWEYVLVATLVSGLVSVVLAWCADSVADFLPVPMLFRWTYVMVTVYFGCFILLHRRRDQASLLDLTVRWILRSIRKLRR